LEHRILGGELFHHDLSHILIEVLLPDTRRFHDTIEGHKQTCNDFSHDASSFDSDLLPCTTFADGFPNMCYTIFPNRSAAVRESMFGRIGEQRENAMAQRSPIVKDGLLTYPQGGSSAQVEVDSADWYTWLETASSFAFRSEHGSFTARKERAGNRRGSLYWRAYYTREGKLHRIYLGKSEELTFERLVVVATALAGQGNVGDPLDADTTAVPSSRASLPGTTLTSEQAAELPPPFPGGDFSRTRIALPTYLTSLLGREQEVQAVSVLLERHEVRLVTLTGPGGVGKTRLAVQVASHLQDTFADGVCFVSLASISDPDLVFSTLAQALGLLEPEHTPLLEYLKSSLHEKHLLLLLDNFEQVVSAAPLMGELLLACPAVKALVTSRTSLRLQGEYEFPVVPLALPGLQERPDAHTIAQSAAVTLFVQRASAIKPGFSLGDANAAVIAAICTRLDGLPLAIELAAARSKLLPPEALLAQLQHRLTVLVGGPRDLPARQQTLRGTIAWSYDLLDQAEKILLRRLAVFVGGCTLEATETVCNAGRDLEIDTLDGVARLVDKSVLRQEEQADSEPRLLMLETIREYALERLAESGEAEALRRQHVAYFLKLAEESEPKMLSAVQATWYRRLEVEHDNLRAALRWTLENGEAEIGLRLAGALYGFWRSCNHLREGRSWLEQVLAQPGAQEHTAARAKALLSAGTMAFLHGDFPAARHLLEESITIGREVGPAGRRTLALALAILGHVILVQGDPTTARELAREGLRLFQEVGEAWGIALALFYLGKGAVELGDLATARSLLEESAALFQASGDRQRLALPVDMLGMVALRQGDYGAARTQFQEALAVAREMGDAQFIADALIHLGTVALRMGDYHGSEALYQQSLALNRAQGYKDGIAEDLAGLAAVASLLGQPKWAARLCGAVEALREANNIKLSALRRAEYDRIVGRIRAQLGHAAFAQAWALGHGMPLEQAIAFAVEMKDALPTGTAQQASHEEAPSDLPSGILFQPSPPLSPRHATKQQFGGLTSRECEVARLVAQGKSNRAIAEELVVGVSTVEAHITHIFTKLGFSSRSQLAAWTVDKGLAQVPQDVEVFKQKH
jgi:predicted ATPase/DNA-binding CsgD family transcriptional regulator